MLFLVATNVVASRTPERRPTETPHARAKKVGIRMTMERKVCFCPTRKTFQILSLEQPEILAPSNFQ